MTRLLVHVEGETEESFVNVILARHLYDRGFSKVSARLIGNARQRERRGGIKPWNAVRKDIVNHLQEDRECIASTMVDYYGMPQSGPKAWSGRTDAGGLAISILANAVEEALAIDIRQAMRSDFSSNRFIPYVMMHEFEALLFSNCDRFGLGIGHPNLSACFQKIRDTFTNPEEIDDSPTGAPSKRVEALVSGYQKPFHGDPCRARNRPRHNARRLSAFWELVGSSGGDTPWSALSEYCICPHCSF